MKSIVNVYKDTGLWHKPPPGIGDYLRGCAYLVQAAREGLLAGQFQPGVNLDLSPGADYLAPCELYRPASRENLVAAREYFDPLRDGDLLQAINAFLRSDEEVLYVSTNKSWRGIDDQPQGEVLGQVAGIMAFTPAFEQETRDRAKLLGLDYTLLHIRDSDRGGAGTPETDDERAFRVRARRFVERVFGMTGPKNLVCISNNERLRDLLCDAYGLANPRTVVKNTGFAGTLSHAELTDIALIRRAAMLHDLSYFAWNSGFSVWASRLFNVRATFSNAGSQL